MSLDPTSLGTAATVTRDNWLAPANLRWALRHSRQVVPTAVISRGNGPVVPLPQGEPVDLDDLAFTADGDRPTLLRDFLLACRVDAFLVLRRGAVVYERYFEGMTASQPHQWASMTKAITGLLANLLARRGVIDLAKPVAAYIPELADSPFGRATVQQNLDMEVSVDWPAEVTDMHWLAAVGLVPHPSGVPATIRDFVRQVGGPAAAPHGSVFRYNNSATEAVAWALCRATGSDWPTLAGEHVWSRLGAEQDATVVLDPTGTPQASGGMSSVVADVARLAEVLRRGGKAGDQQAVDPGAVASLLAPHDNADRFARGNIATGRAGYSYRNGVFQVNDGAGSFQLSGRFGQRVHVNPQAELTVVQFASYLGHGEETALAFSHAVRAIADRLR